MNEKAKKTTDAGKDADKLFLTDLKVADFAKGLAQLPQLGDMLRLAGLQDGRTMSGVRITSARMDALRAKAIGDPRAAKKARRAEAHATRLADALKREEARVRPNESVLGPLLGMAGKFRLTGKVLDKSGAPVPNASVEFAGENTGVIFTAKTDENGIYDLIVPVGKETDKADEGEPIRGTVEQDGQILMAALGGLIKEGTVAHKILTVPLLQTLGELAIPIATKGRQRETPETPAKTTKVRDIQTPSQTAKESKVQPKPTKTGETPAKTAKETKASATVKAKAIQGPKSPDAAKIKTARDAKDKATATAITGGKAKSATSLRPKTRARKPKT